MIGRHAPRTHVLGRHVGRLPGPMLVVMTGMHGNEPAGVEAARRVLARLAERRPETFVGELSCLVGNTSALQAGVRFFEKDLNRQWTLEHIAGLRQADPTTLGPEDAEQVGLIAAIDATLARVEGSAYFIDLHTTSAEGIPFVLIGDTLGNRMLAEATQLPILLGLEEQIDGSLLEYINHLGHLTLGVEGGQHDAPEAIDNHESLLWLSLTAAGLLPAESIPEYEASRERLSAAGSTQPRWVEIRYRHPLGNDDQFKMIPGFDNFQKVAAGQLVARDRNGEIRTRERGLMLLPKYQGRGDDGYFLGRRVRSTWLRLSAALRRMGFDRRVHWLPGVRRDPERPDDLWVDTRIARLFPVQVFHLLGYRRRRRIGARLSMTRRRDMVAGQVVRAHEPDAA